MPPEATAKPNLVDPCIMRVTRKKWGLNQFDMATVLGVHRRTLQGWESGKFPIPLMALDASAALTKKKIKERLQ